MFQVGDIVKINPFMKNQMYITIKDEERFEVKEIFFDATSPVIKIDTAKPMKGIPYRKNFHVYAEYFELVDRKQVKELDLKDFEDLYI